MKILYLTQYAIDGQFQSQFYNYSKDISKDFQVKVCYLFSFKDNNSLIAGYVNNGIKVSSLDFSGSRISIPNLFRYIKYLKVNDCDIVHSQHPIAGFYNKVGTRLFNLLYNRKIKIIVEQRCVKKNLSFFARILETLTHPFANLVLCSSDSVELSYFNKVNYHSDYLDGRKIRHFTFYNSINTDSFENQKKTEIKDLKSQELIRICVVGRNESVKQPLLVLQSMKYLRANITNFKLFFAGTGSLDDQLKIFVRENDLEKYVEFLGNIDYVPQLLADCDIYINYSKHEGLCKSLLESMAAGTPVIASKVDGNREVIEDDNIFGILVDDKSPEKLAEAVQMLISNSGLYNRYSELGKQRVAKFDSKFQIKEMENIYRRLLNGI